MSDEKRPHCATFTDVAIERMADMIEKHLPLTGVVANGDRIPILVDRFAGIGGIHKIVHYLPSPVHTKGYELEPEWADQHPLNQVGNALHIDMPDESVDVEVFSPAFGNRMADNYDGRGTCKLCDGLGLVNVEGTDVPLVEMACARCGGSGKDSSKRATYRISLGRALSKDSGAALQWGHKYRVFHEAVLDDCWRTLRPGGLIVVDIKDHQRRKKWQQVPQWWAEAVEAKGFEPLEITTYPVASMRFGANGDARAEEAWIITARKPTSKDLA